MKTLIIAMTLGALVAAPAVAEPHKADVGDRSRSAQTAYNAVTPFGSPADRQKPQSTMSAAREAAIHECSMKSRQYTETAWGDMQMQQFRACMKQHGQPE